MTEKAQNGLWPQLCGVMQQAEADWGGLAPPGTRLAVLPLGALDDVDEMLANAAEAELASLLTPAEQARLAELSLPKRRREWLGGRCAAKYALMRFAARNDARPAHPGIFGIANDEHGRPFFVRAVREYACLAALPRLSLSHGGGFAAALVASAACGVDVQALSPRLSKVQERFADGAELALGAGAGLEPLSWLALIWTAKEAIKKALYASEPTFMERFRVIALDGDPAGDAPVLVRCALMDRPDTVTVRAVLRGQHALALTVEEETKNA